MRKLIKTTAFILAAVLTASCVFAGNFKDACDLVAQGRVKESIKITDIAYQDESGFFYLNKDENGNTLLHCAQDGHTASWLSTIIRTKVEKANPYQPLGDNNYRIQRISDISKSLISATRNKKGLSAFEQAVVKGKTEVALEYALSENNPAFALARLANKTSVSKNTLQTVLGKYRSSLPLDENKKLSASIKNPELKKIFQNEEQTALDNTFSKKFERFAGTVKEKIKERVAAHARWQRELDELGVYTGPKY
ncbi:hypothetical protein Emin_1312 [Elusimicrobium minutum Pei191]|uniref:Uncharacterized protein n=1 Tax=Elusimicrobium minutum (strain Pei191) TaxID=445932 RepID=B2KEB6_ELUMP|nr:hypothetical protein [Elusimicrobium minutum]ACC98862.1 hypothetical protein Emin_1312 [Elusimicrobium minutum Pei191]